MPETAIIEFYREHCADHSGRRLSTIHALRPEELEQSHDYIQWLFPLPEPSSANPYAPVLLESDIVEFAQDEHLKARLLQSLAVMLHFYGLDLRDTADGPKITGSEDFVARSRVWLRPYNHNFLRISRILRSLALLGCNSHAMALFDCLKGIYRDHSGVIGDRTFRYWKSAVGRNEHADENLRHP